jgi:hypothetical protein
MTNEAMSLNKAQCATVGMWYALTFVCRVFIKCNESLAFDTGLLNTLAMDNLSSISVARMLRSRAEERRVAVATDGCWHMLRLRPRTHETIWRFATRRNQSNERTLWHLAFNLNALAYRASCYVATPE